MLNLNYSTVKRKLSKSSAHITQFEVQMPIIFVVIKSYAISNTPLNALGEAITVYNDQASRVTVWEG